jgi:hypothetical protein
MTEDFPLPPELQGLEQRLAARPRPQPSSRLKEQVLGSLRSELRRSQGGARWAFAVAVAATVLLWLNLSLSATQATDFGLRLDGRRQPVEPIAAEIRQLLPDLPPHEALRQAVLLRAGAGVVPCLVLSANPAARAVNEQRAKPAD